MLDSTRDEHASVRTFARKCIYGDDSSIGVPFIVQLMGTEDANLFCEKVDHFAEHFRNLYDSSSWGVIEM